MIRLLLLPTGHPLIFQHKWVRSSTQSYPRFNLPMGRSPGFASTATDVRPIQTWFPSGSSLKGLNLPLTVTRRVIMQKARHHPCKHRALTACRRTVSGTFNSPYRGTFHLSLALLDSLSVVREYLALGGGPPNFRPDFTWLALLVKLTILHLRLRDCHPLWFRFPSDSSGFLKSTGWSRFARRY